MSHNDSSGNKRGKNWRYEDRQKYHGLYGPEILDHQELRYYRQSLDAKSLPEEEEKYHRVFHKNSYAHNLVNEFWNYFRRNNITFLLWDWGSERAEDNAVSSADTDLQVILNELSQELTEPEMRVLAFVLNKSQLLRCLGDFSSIPLMKPILDEVLRNDIKSGTQGAVFVHNKYRFDQALESLKRKIMAKFPNLADKLRGHGR